MRIPAVVCFEFVFLAFLSYFDELYLFFLSLLNEDSLILFNEIGVPPKSNGQFLSSDASYSSS
jgi:hypothetical protein